MSSSDRPSKPPSGSSVTPTLPPDARSSAGRVTVKRRKLKATLSHVDTSVGPIRVLVLSSGPDLALSLKVELGSAIAAAAADDLLKALQLVGRFDPRAVVIDLVNPTPHGPALARAVLSELTNDVPVFFWGEKAQEGYLKAMPAGRRGVWVDHTDGVSPLVDHFRAMAASTTA